MISPVYHVILSFSFIYAHFFGEKILTVAHCYKLRSDPFVKFRKRDGTEHKTSRSHIYVYIHIYFCFSFLYAHFVYGFYFSVTITTCSFFYLFTDFDFHLGFVIEQCSFYLFSFSHGEHAEAVIGLFFSCHFFKTLTLHLTSAYLCRLCDSCFSSSLFRLIKLAFNSLVRNKGNKCYIY